MSEKMTVDEALERADSDKQYIKEFRGARFTDSDLALFCLAAEVRRLREENEALKRAMPSFEPPPFSSKRMPKS